MSDFEKFKEQLPSKETFYSSSTGKKKQMAKNMNISIEAEKNNDKDGKALYKLMKNAIYRKTMENLRNGIDVKLVNNEKDYLKCTSKPSYMPHKIAIRKKTLALKLNKPAYIGRLHIRIE